MKRFQETRLYEFLEDRYYDVRDFLDDVRDRFSRRDYDDDDEYFSVFDEKKPWYKEKKPVIAMISSVIIAIPLVFYVKDTIAKRNAENEIKPLSANQTVEGKTLSLGNGNDESTSLTMADLHQALQTGDGRSKYNSFLAKNSDVSVSAKRQLPEIGADTVITKLSDGVVLILFKNDAIIQMQDFNSDIEAKDYITALINANATTNDDGSTTTANGVTLPSDDDSDESSDDNDDSALDTFDDESDTDLSEESTAGNITTNVDGDDQDEMADDLLAASQAREKNAYDEKNEYKIQLEKEKEARKKAEQAKKKAEKAKKKAEDEAKQAQSEAEKAELAQLRKEAEAAQQAANKAKQDAERASQKAEQAERALTVSNFKDRIHVGMSASSYQNVISKYNWSKASTIALYDGAYMHVFKTKGGSYMTVGINNSNTKVTTVKQVASLDKAKTLAKSMKYQSAYNANEAIKKHAENAGPNHDEALMETVISKHLKINTKLKAVKSYLEKDGVEHVATFDVGTKGDMYVITASEGFVTVLIHNGVVTATKHVKNLNAAVKLANEQYKD